jgi:hypothetical protein
MAAADISPLIVLVSGTIGSSRRRTADLDLHVHGLGFTNVFIFHKIPHKINYVQFLN